MKYDVFIEATGSMAPELDFLAKAVSDDTIPSRYFKSCIYAEPSEQRAGALRAAATDGCRLHLVDPLEGTAEIPGITPGFWRVLKNTPETVWLVRVSDETVKEGKYIFPDYRKIMPSGKAEYTTTFDGFDFTGRDANHSGLAEFIHGFPEATALNLSYLQSLGTSFEWDVRWYGHDKALKFTEGGRVAVIMPMLA